MPSYTYKCSQCDTTFTVEQSMTEDVLTDCRDCDGAIYRVIGKNIGIQFVGSGFYSNDVKQASSSTTSTND